MIKIRTLSALTAALALAGGASATSVLLSDSNTSANDTVNQAVLLNGSSTLYVWVDVDPGQTITGLGLDIVSSVASVLEATSYTIYNNTYQSGDDTWQGTDSGTIGDLVDDSNAVAVFIAAGLDQSSINTFNGTTDGNAFLVGEVAFNATALGQTSVSLAIGANEITDQNLGALTPTFVGGTVYVPGFLGDANLDGQVSLADLDVLGQNFGGPGEWTEGDFNGDGNVTLADLDILGQNFGSGPLTQAEALAYIGVVPEPTSLALLGLGGLLIARRRRG